MSIKDSLRSPAFGRGLQAALPTMPGLFTFGVITVVATIGAGFSPLVALAMTFVVYAGSAQLVAVQMAAAGTPLVIILAATLIINARFVIYSLGVTDRMRDQSLARRTAVSYMLSDNGYGLLVTRYPFRTGDRAEHDRFLGILVGCWGAWQAGAIAGAVLGAAVPPGWSLEFTISLTFLAMAVVATRDRPQLVAAVAATTIVIATWHWPFRIGLILAIVGGVAAGLAAQRLARR